MGPDIADRFLVENNKCSLKLSYLKDYNDPFEFFLTIDYNQPPEILAFYNEIISMVTQHPVTCFSKSPVSTPMWAHYAANSQGFVAEFDEEKLSEWLDSHEAGSDFGDIDYQDTPHQHMQETLLKAHYIGKYRHVTWLWQAVTTAAYYTKQNCWNYEQERRLVTSETLTTKINANLSLLLVPSEFVKSLIVGAKASDETKSKIRQLCIDLNCNYYEKRIGRSSTTPFFVNANNMTFTFKDGEIAEHLDSCTSCLEPKLGRDSEKCSWCNITPYDEEEAAHKNAFRLLDRAGILEGYLERFMQVGAK